METLRDYLIHLKRKHEYKTIHIYKDHCTFHDINTPYADVKRTFAEGIEHILECTLIGSYVEEGLILNPRVKEEHGMDVPALLTYYINRK